MPYYDKDKNIKVSELSTAYMEAGTISYLQMMLL